MTKAGLVNISIQMLYTALKDGECIEDDDLLMNAKWIVEHSTGLTVEIMKEHIKQAYTVELNEEQVALDAKEMTTRELSSKYNIPTTTMYEYLKKHNIKMKRKQTDYDSLSIVLKSYNGKYTITQMSRIAGVNYYTVRHCCELFDIPFKEKVC